MKSASDQKQSLVVYCVFLVLSILGAASALASGKPLLSNPLAAYAMVWVFDVLLVIPHELAHALSARAFGIPNIRIIIGSGNPVWSGRLLGFTWLFNQWPLGGFTLFGREAQAKRSHYIVSIAAGPAVSAIGMLLVVCASGPLRISSWSGVFFWANAIVFAQSAFPYYAETVAGRTPNDAMIILQLLFPRFFIEKRRDDSYLIKRAGWLKRGSLILLGILFVVLLTFAALIGFVMFAHEGVFPAIIPILLFLGLAVWVGRKFLRCAREPFIIEEAPQGPEDDLSKRAFEALCQTSPAYKDPTFWTQGLELSGSQSEQILQRLNAFLQKYPYDPYLLYTKAHYLSELDRYDEAVQTIRSAPTTSLDPLSKHALLAAQMNHLSHAQNFQAIRTLTEAALDGDDSPELKAHAADAAVSYMLYQELLDDLPTMERWIRRALELAPTDRGIGATFEGVLVEKGCFDEAEPLLAQRIRSETNLHNRAYAFFYMSVIRSAQGRFPEARQMIERANLLSEEKWLQRRSAKKLNEIESSEAATAKPT